MLPSRVTCSLCVTADVERENWPTWRIFLRPRKDLVDKREQLNKDAARMVGMIESILEHEREIRNLPKAESEHESESKSMDDIPEVYEESL